MGALSYVIEQRLLDDVPGFEELTLRTLGVKNVTPSEHLANIAVPRALLEKDGLRPADYDRICQDDGAQWLEGRIVTQVTRRIVRARPVA